MKEALIIFVRNPELGKVKSRLAASVGEAKALNVYIELLRHTQSISLPVVASKYVYYADKVNKDDLWNGYKKRMQEGNNLGDRMKNAFAELLSEGFEKICIIGSDCYELTTEIIDNAFKSLAYYDTVIGPANDGGYYLLGMKLPLKDLFTDIEWSSASVLSKTMEKINTQNLSMFLLPVLSDVDEVKDIQNTALGNLV